MAGALRMRVYGDGRCELECRRVALGYLLGLNTGGHILVATGMLDAFPFRDRKGGSHAALNAVGNAGPVIRGAGEVQAGKSTEGAFNPLDALAKAGWRR